MRRRFRQSWVPLFLLLCVSTGARTEPRTVWRGKVVGVADGDTITVMHDRRPVRIRLHGIDCPEKRQPFGNKAKQLTSRLVFGKVVTVQPVATDRYGRTVAKVSVGGQSLNEALVKAGLAWWYERYARRDKVLALLQDRARKARRGLWSQEKPVPPWVYRHRGRPFHGNTRSRVFHGPRCQHYRCKHCTEKFKSRRAARKAGYRAHRACVRTRAH